MVDQVLRQLSIVMLLVLACPLVLGAFSLDINPLDNEIYRNESASFEVTIANFNQQDAQFQGYTLDPAWRVNTIPSKLFVPAGGQDTLILRLTPTSDASYGTQGVALTFKNLEPEGGIIQKSAVLNLRDAFLPNREYEAAVSLAITMPYDVDPRKDIPIRVELRNRNALNISNLTLEVRSDDFTLYEPFDLAPLSEKTRDLQGVRMDAMTPPGEGDVVVAINYRGQRITQITKNYRIIEYSTIDQDIQEEGFLFKTTKTVTVRNDGNVENTALVSVPTSVIKRMFVHSEDIDNYRGERDGKPVLVWSIPLQPNESQTFTYTENYRVLVILLLGVVAVWVLYFVLRSPLVVLKEAVGVMKHDGVSQIKVRIFLRNRSARMIRDLQVTDKVPSLAEVMHAQAPGSIVPSKIAVNDKQGTLLKWHLEVLEPYEERVLTYHAKSKLKIIGKLSLPHAKARFSSKGKDRVIYSNNIEIVERFRDK